MSIICLSTFQNIVSKNFYCLMRFFLSIDSPETITYSSFISKESVRVALFLVALNDMDVHLTDIGNVYFTAPTMEKGYIVAGDEFGPELKGWLMKIIQALYGLRQCFMLTWL